MSSSHSDANIANQIDQFGGVNAIVGTEDLQFFQHRVFDLCWNLLGLGAFIHGELLIDFINALNEWTQIIQEFFKDLQLETEFFEVGAQLCFILFKSCVCPFSVCGIVGIEVVIPGFLAASFQVFNSLQKLRKHFEVIFPAIDLFIQDYTVKTLVPIDELGSEVDVELTGDAD